MADQIQPMADIGQPPVPGEGSPSCLARSLAKVIQTEPVLEAVIVTPGEETLSVATLGKEKGSDLEGKVGQAVAEGARSGAGIGCGLLAGTNNCCNCPWPLEEALKSAITISRTDGGVTFARFTCPTAPRFWRWRKLPLPKFVQRELELPTGHEALDEWKPQLIAAIICGCLVLAAFYAEATALRLALLVGSYLAGGWYAAVEMWERLQKGALDVHFLMLAVAAGSASIGAWNEGAILLFLFSISGALEHYAIGRTQREIESLFKASPKTAWVIDVTGREIELPVEQLRAGMLFAAKPGSQFPADGMVKRGATAADESNLTGESSPVDKTVGDPVLAGTLNLWGSVQVQVIRPAAESALQKVIHLIRKAQQSKAPSQRFTDRFGSSYTVIVLIMTVVMFFAWWLAYDLSPFASTPDARSAFYRAMTLLVVASPCALVLSIPSAILAAIAWAARRGILFRGGAAVEMLAEVDVVALDKTGTLTTGELSIQSVTTQPAEQLPAAERIAYALARHSTHPLSRALTAHGQRQGWDILPVDHLESVAGQGISGRIDGQLCLLGRREFVESLVPESARQWMNRLPEHRPSGIGQPEVWLATNQLAACIQLHDELRPESAALIEALRKAGLRTVLLTGDRRENAATIHRELPIDEVRAELRPEDKLEYIIQQNKSGQRVAMVGDGVNDAPSLAAAHVSVAMGARGADAALEQADVVLMRDRLENFLAAFHLSQRARRIIQQNLFVSLGTVIVLVGFALAGQIPLTVGVIGHEGSTVLVVLNSLRLLFTSASEPTPRRRT